MRQTGGGVCRLRTPIARCTFPEEESVEKSLSYQARREWLQQTASQYREASPSQKRALLDAFIATTGYVRKYARWLLNHAEEAQQRLQRPRPRQYGPEVQHALFLVWHSANLKQQIPIRMFQEWKETQPGLTSSGTGVPIAAPTSREATSTH